MYHSYCIDDCFVHIQLSWFALFRYDFDDPVFDDILQWTNDFTLGNGFLNVNLFLPKFLNAIFEGKVDKQLFYINKLIIKHRSNTNR